MVGVHILSKRTLWKPTHLQDPTTVQSRTGDPESGIHIAI